MPLRSKWGAMLQLVINHLINVCAVKFERRKQYVCMAGSGQGHDSRPLHAYPVNTYTYYMLDVSSRQNKARHRSAPRPRLRFPAMI